MSEGDLGAVFRDEGDVVTMEIPGFGWISIVHGPMIDDEGEDRRAGLAGGASPHEPREQPMSEGKRDLGPCAVCGLSVFDEDGAAFNFDGEVIHPAGSFCYEHAWGPDASPLTERNTKTAEMLGRLVAGWAGKTGGPRRHVEVMLWLRNLTPADRAPADGIVFSVEGGDVVVALIPDYERVGGIVSVEDLEDGRWLPLQDAPARVEEWSNLLPRRESRALLSTFLTIVRETSARTVTS